MKKNNKLHTTYSVIVQLIIFSLVWVGVYNIYTTSLNTNWVWWVDFIFAGGVTINLFILNWILKWHKEN